jgi:hypothetical protein
MKKQDTAAIWENIDKLQKWKDNPRKNKAAIKHVAESIKRFGFASPIIARAADKMIIAGHTRYEAAKDLGLDKVPVRYLDLDPADSKLLALADNKTAEVADWDEEKLEQVMQDLLDEGLSLDGLGWTDTELADIVQELKEEEIKEDEAPELEDTEVHSVLGEIYELGPHRLICGDWRKTELRETAFKQLHPTAGIHDPPYGINAVNVKKGETKGKTGGGGPIGGKKKKGKFVAAKEYLPIHEDDVPFNPTDLLDVLPESILWGANHFSSKLKDTRGWIVWDKKTKEWEGNTFSDGELAWTPYNKILKIYRHLWMGIARIGDRNIEYERVHPTQKPVGLIVKIIQDYLSNHECIADFFLGSGTTLIACAESEKKCVGFEIEPSYCDVIRRRWTRYAKENNIDVGPGGLDG